MKTKLQHSLLYLSCIVLMACGKTPSKSQMVECPMCQGTGVFEIMPGDIFAPREECALCNGTGMCTEEQANQMLELMGRTNKRQQTTYTGHSGRSVPEIQHDLYNARRLLYDMERQYRECSSRTIAAQYPQMIAEQRERVWRLEEELYNAYH